MSAFGSGYFVVVAKPFYRLSSSDTVFYSFYAANIATLMIGFNNWHVNPILITLLAYSHCGSQCYEHK